ncbi:MAG TPA: hypothetical protein VNK48_17705 [Xanthobacteraceae bacterium]|nr:hypothetical protein [Xanthobacteraceae bacterium]
MTCIHPAAAAEQRRRWLRPNAHLYWRPDAARVLPAHLHHLLPPQLRPSPEDDCDCARSNVVPWTGRRGQWMPARESLRAAATRSRPGIDVLPCRREAEEKHAELLALKSQLLLLRLGLLLRRHERALWQDREGALKAGFRPDQPRWPAGSGRISGRWSGGAGTGGPVADESTPARVRLASADKPNRSRALRNAILLQAAKRAIDAYRSDKGLWDLFRGRVGAVTVTTINGENIFGSNSTSPTYSGIDFREATELRDRYLQANPELAARSNTGFKPHDAFYHAETTVLLRAARANGGTLAGQTLEVFGDTKLCNSCAEVLPFVGMQLGNPTVIFVNPNGARRTMRDGAWLKDSQQ